MANPFETLLYQAVASEYGIVLSHEAPQKLMQKLYQLKRGKDLPLRIVEMPNNEVWIVRCPDESKNPSSESTSGSSSPTSNESKNSGGPPSE